MCGIAGELALQVGRRRANLSRVEQMSRQIARRGPDASGLWCDASQNDSRVALAHRRLAILDLSSRGAQPMHDQESGLCVVFNGILYNWKELRAQLTKLGHRFKSQSDTEVLLRGWQQWGQDVLERIDGVFAFALWDGQSQSLYLARDRLGIKPVYFHQDQHHLRFCSNIQGLLASGKVGLQLDKQALAMHFSLHGVVPAPRTVLAEVRKLAPGHILSVDPNGTVAIRRWWVLKPMAPLRDRRAWRERTWELLVEAVRKRFDVSDTPVGVLLSGGLDSSIVVAILAMLGRQIKTYSIGFEDDAGEAGNEFGYSDQVVERYDTEHHKWVIDNHGLLDRLPEVIAAMPEPMPAQDCSGFYLLAECVSADVKLVLSGQGADELLAGYFWYPLMERASGNDWQRFSQHYIDHSPEQYRQLMSESWHADPGCRDIFEQRMAEAQKICGDDFVNQLLYWDLTTLITDDPVKRVDSMCLSFGLEARVPFLDANLLAGVCAMPSSMKLARGGKGVLRDLASDHLPQAIIERNKGYFPVPALKFIRGEFSELIGDVLNSQACRHRDLFNRSVVDALMAKPNDEASFTRLRGNKLWHYALLEMWLQSMEGLPAGGQEH